jgi:LysM repeat protein
LFKLDPADYKGWAYGLKKAGYATNPRYPEKLIQSIEKYNLQQYSLLAVSEVPKYDRSQFEDDKEVPFVYVEESSAETGSADSPTPLKEKVTYLNRTRCIQAAKGTSLLAIAGRFNVPLAKLLQYNDLITDGLLQKDQPIYLEKKPVEGAVAEYTTRAGESLHDVAQQQGIQLEWLAVYNQLSTQTVISAGTRLALRPSAITAAVSSGKPAAGSAAGLHTVQQGEGLYAIARKYSVTVQQLRTWNNLGSDQLSIGQQLVVSK